MNINDPFGRMQSRRQRDYESLCRSLKKAGITNRNDAQKLVLNLHRRKRIGLMITLPLTALLALLLPELRVMVIAFGGLAVLWLVNATRKGVEFVERYIDEELADSGDSAEF